MYFQIRKNKNNQAASANPTRVLTNPTKLDHITTILLSLHWLNVCKVLHFKVLSLVNTALNGLEPKYDLHLRSCQTPSFESMCPGPEPIQRKQYLVSVLLTSKTSS